MAKLTDALLPELLTPAADDLIYIVDVSDPTSDPAGTSKKIKSLNFMATAVTDSVTSTVYHIGAEDGVIVLIEQ